MLSSKRAGLLSAVLILGPQLTQPRLLSLRDRGLGDQTAENELAGRVEPVAGQRIDDFTPYALLDGIQVRRWLRTAPPRDAGNDSERGCGLAGHGRNSPSRWKLARDPKIDHVSGGGRRARRDSAGLAKFYEPPCELTEFVLQRDKLGIPALGTQFLAGFPLSAARDVFCTPIQLRPDYNLTASISQNSNDLF
jgi:hypothetical protein